MSELWRASAGDLKGGYASGLYTPVDAVESCLERITRLDADIGAFTVVARDRALTEAAALSRELRDGIERGPLHGVPFAVKDLFDVTGTVTRAGSNVPVGGRIHPAPRDAAVIQRLREAGAIFLGRTRTHEYAWGMTTRHPLGTGTANPWDLHRITGGSSGGSAAAVAAGFAPLALGSDTGGSIRIPAAFCGVVGWKPRKGSIPTEGLVPLAPSLDHVGVLARTVDDAATAHMVAAGSDSRRLETPPPHLLRVGVMEDWTLPRLQPSIEAVIADGLHKLASDGVTLRPVSVPSAASALEIFSPIQMSEALHVHRDVLGTWPDWASTYGVDVAERLRLAESVTDEEVATARARRADIKLQLGIGLGEVDAVILPAAPCAPPALADPDRVTLAGETVPLRNAVLPFTVLANVTGAPCVVVPLGRDTDGLPVGVQLLAAPDGDEMKLLAIATTVSHIFGSLGWPDP